MKTKEKTPTVPQELKNMTKTNVLITWKEFTTRSGITLDPQALQMAEAKLNQCCQVLAVGDEVKSIKVGDFVLMGGAGRLITINDVVYGIIKEHMVDAVFNKEPKIGKDEGKSQGEIKTSVTQSQLEKFSNKHRYKG